MPQLFDSHVHLSDPQYEGMIDFVLSSMEKLKIKACAVSVDNHTSQLTLNLAKKSNQILPFIGIHPQNAADSLESVVQLIQENASIISGIGEIGLDRTYCKNDEELKRQKHVFLNLLSIAEKLKKPVSIHSRRTLQEILDLLPSYHNVNCLLHWFDGSKKQLRQAMDLECFVSFGPASIYSKDKHILISHTDADKILVETDGPVRYSHCFEMKPAQPIFIASIIWCIANIVKKSYDECTHMLELNSKNYLQI